MTRDSRLDAARGVAIVAIVMVHVLRGMHGSGLVDCSVSTTFDRIVGLWCLNVFAFVGGAFVARSVQRRGAGSYVRDRVFRIFAIFVVWTLLQGGVQLAAAGLINIPLSVTGVLSLWHPNSQLWYLPFLIVVTVVFVPLQPWKSQRAWWILGAAAVLSFAFWGYDGGYVGTQGLGLVVFMVGGMILGSERVQGVLDRFSVRSAGLLSAAVLVFASVVSVLTSATMSTVFFEDRTLFTTAVGIVLALLGSAAILLFGQAARAWALPALLGRRSLDIFLGHIMMAAGARIVLLHLGVTSVWVIGVCAVLAGIIGSLLLADLLRRVGLGWVFDGPGWPVRNRVGSAHG